MKKLTGIRMRLPEGRQPGYYAQVIKRLAASGATIDRDKELLFAEDAAAEDALAVLERYKVSYERSPWLLLDEPDWTRTRIWSDYTVETRAGNAFLDLSLAAVVRIDPEGGDSALEQAILQLNEHAIGFRPDMRDCGIVAVDRQLIPLGEGIAAAYRCTISILQ